MGTKYIEASLPYDVQCDNGKTLRKGSPYHVEVINRDPTDYQIDIISDDDSTKSCKARLSGDRTDFESEGIYMKENCENKEKDHSWSDFNQFKTIDEYLPSEGEGDTKATQLSTAVSKLVYKWFNDGDVPDNVHSSLIGWANDISSYANWIDEYYDNSFYDKYIKCYCKSDYTDLLFNLVKQVDSEIDSYADEEKVGSVYDCDGSFKFEEYEDDEEDDDDFNDNEDESDDTFNESQNVFQMPAKRKKNLDTLYDLAMGNIDEDDIEYNPDDECDEVYSDLIDDALDSGFSMKISKLYLTGFKDDALEEAKKFVKAKLPDLDQETSDRYAASIVQDYKDLAWEQE